MDEQCCRKCRFWQSLIAEEGLGQCKRYPPSMLPETDVRGDVITGTPQAMRIGWPEMNEAQWCGEFLPGGNP